MEYTLKLAIARAKKEFEKYGWDNYCSIEGLWVVMKGLYSLREDEKADFFKSISKWSIKNNYGLN